MLAHPVSAKIRRMQNDVGSSTLDSVRNYYGKVLSSSQDLKTNACCLPGAVPAHLREKIARIHPEVQDRFYGCGSPIPSALEGATVLDLGCGTGRDVYLLSQLVGPRGRVIGIDMTEEQLAVARKHLDWHMKLFGYSQPNVEFHQGFIEDLAALGIADGSIDVVISNCVVNLSPDKRRVFSEIFRVLKPGGELLFSDVFSGRRVPEPLTKDPVLLGECLSGALYKEDFRRLMRDMGCLDFRVVSKSPLAVTEPSVKAKLGNIDFQSITFRAFKLGLEDLCEDYGQVATYLGTLSDAPHAFELDDHHRFEKGRPMLICGNTAAMLQNTRYASHFRVQGDRSVHFGVFPCGPTPGSMMAAGATSAGGGLSSSSGGCC